MKVAHIFKALNAGGIEKWLTDFSITNERLNLFELHFVLQTKEVGFFEKSHDFNNIIIKKIDLNLGYVSYFWNLYKYFRKEKFDVVHSHVHHFSAWVLLIAYLAGVKVRVAHCHNDKRKEYLNVSTKKKIYLWVSKVIIDKFSNRKIAVSDLACQSLFPNTNDDVNIIPCGLNFSGEDYVGSHVNKLSEKKPIIVGHIGSFTPQKNHEFVCSLAKDLNDKHSGGYKFQLVGSGNLFDEIKEKVSELGLESSIEFLGLRDDVSELIKYQFDVVILPSLHEGLAMVALETQFYGKRLIVSDRLSKQHSLSDYIEYRSILSTDEFISSLESLTFPTEEQIKKARADILASNLNIENNLRIIKSIYN
ncbi:hypothetical protein BBM24_17765 [Vibrio parahaemolyticus]|uniref:glycosyltransferase n=3 Tax=Vibrio parahaemolyticus TaxID=670 RepID=UPI00084A95FF|nr:glycosyltransferase [Vibrio parahaemolyticus]EHO8535991.1 glycosyltransferase [Vibrio parahaemolyticus]EIF2842171.1 glycosyltransferase [Vibrio parahaemolyticus]EIJ2228717.1 glycosyltransferase [Vibrio parahaemolyticus]ODY32283.1 hypothetical protein BBM22_22040 [Vibrio parahaemolyticus]ODY40402.1 hypothetical protein BBM24_17765 [Vibrio parahaemolyticus]